MIFAVIEVVVTHKPEETVLKYYNDNNIILIQINLTSDNDIDELESKIALPDQVSTCYNPKCKTCGHFQQKKLMTIIDGPCWKCGSTMKIATITSSSCGNNLRPSVFTDDEIIFASSKGVILKTQYSKAVHDSYLANSCPKCGSFAGNFYLFAQYISPADCGELPSQKFDIGYLCGYCDDAAFENNQ